MENLTPYVVLGMIVMYLQRYLKKFDWYGRFVTAMPLADRWMHRIVAGTFSLFAALGIQYTASGDAATGWQISLGIPAVSTLLDAAWSWVQTFTIQQIAYDATRRPPAMPHDQPVTAEPLKRRMT